MTHGNNSEIKANHENMTCLGRWVSEEYKPGLVSVIIPTYNRAHLIEETLNSVYGQTYRPIELIVVDDGSTDSTEDVLKVWKASHNTDMAFEITLIFNKKRGAPAARNSGVVNSHGEYI